MQKNILPLTLIALCFNTLIKSFDEDFEQSEKNKARKTKAAYIVGATAAITSMGYYIFQKHLYKDKVIPSPQPTATPGSQHNNYFELLFTTIGAGHSIYQYFKQRKMYPEQVITFRPLNSTASVTKSVAGLKFIYYSSTGLIKYKTGEIIGKKIDNLWQNNNE